MTHLLVVRHGRTVWHAENRYAGSTDVELAPTGYEQAERLAAWASDARLTAIWCSHLRRARETAAPAAHATGLDVHIDKRLSELDFGLVEGKTISEAEQLYPEAISRFKSDPVANPMPGGEDPRQAASRFVTALREIAAANPNGRVLIVAHNTIIRLMLCALLGIPLARYRTIFPGVRNAALTEIRLDSENAALIQYNAPLIPK